VTAESSDLSNGLNEQVVSLEGAGGIHLECRQFHMPFLVLANLVTFVSHMVLFVLGGGHYLQLRAELGLQPPPTVHGFRHTGHAV
jgi:hypothetical protein